MKILITGSNGLLGQALLLQVHKYLLLHTATTFFALSKSENKAILPPTTLFLQADLSKKEEVEKIFLAIQPTIVIHAAALTQPDACQTDQQAAIKQNIDATFYVAQACKQYSSFLVYLSTDFIFDGNKGMYVENDEPNPINFYGWTKLEGEKLLATMQIAHAIVRTCLVYGTNLNMSRPNIISWVKNNLEQGKPIQVVNDQFRTPTLVADLAWACLEIASKKLAGIWHIAGKDCLTPYQMAMLTADYFRLDQSLISPTNAALFTEIAKRPLKTGFNSSKATQLIGYQPHSFAEGLAKIVW
jgi:dTDP-4-dehydrorhamnose reductase